MALAMPDLCGLHPVSSATGQSGAAPRGGQRDVERTGGHAYGAVARLRSATGLRWQVGGQLGPMARP